MRGIVIGGGIGGLTSMLALKRVGVSLKLLESKESLLCHSSLYLGLWDTSIQILNKIEIFNEIKDDFQPVIQSSFKDITGHTLVTPYNHLQPLPSHFLFLFLLVFCYFFSFLFLSYFFFLFLS